MDRLKILHTARNFIPTIGGVQECIYHISRNLINKDYSCRVLTLDYDISNKRRRFKKIEKIEGIEIFRVSGIGHYKKPVPLNIPVRLFEWADIVHIHDLRLFYETGILLKSFLKYKTILSTHGLIMHTDEIKMIKKILLPLYYRPTIRKYMDGVICDSRQDFHNIQDKRIKNLFLIENGIDFDFYGNIKKDVRKYRFLYFGRIDKNKGLNLLLPVLAGLKDINWKIDIIGNGRPSLINDLKRLALKLGITEKVFFQGFINKDRLAKKMSEAEICFFPSTYEGFGLSLLEAMASSTVCIANNIPTYRTFIENKVNGLILDFKNTAKASKELQEVLKIYPDIQKKISNNARLKAREYDWKNKIKLYDKVYRKIIE